jgi:hypothetical protein
MDLDRIMARVDRILAWLEAICGILLGLIYLGYVMAFFGASLSLWAQPHPSVAAISYAFFYGGLLLLGVSVKKLGEMVQSSNSAAQPLNVAAQPASESVREETSVDREEAGVSANKASGKPAGPAPIVAPIAIRWGRYRANEKPKA